MAIGIASVSDLGAIERPQNVLRDGGTSIRLSPTSSKMAWFFGDTIISGHMSDNSMATAPIVTPMNLDDMNPITNQFIPHNDAEMNWNNTHDGTKDRYAVWPSTVIRRRDGKIAMGYEVVHIQPSGWISTSVGIAMTDASLQNVTRYTTFSNSGLVPEWKYGFSWPTLSRDRKTVFLFCLSKDTTDWLSRSIMVAKVLAGQIEKPSAYTFWNGSVWSPNMKEAVYVVPGSAGAAAQFSVAYNAYLGAWLGVFMTIGSVARFITAPSPQGPWSDPIDVFTGMTPKSGQFDYSLIQHRELQKRNGKVIFLTYAHPIADWDADLRFVRVTLV